MHEACQRTERRGEPLMKPGLVAQSQETRTDLGMVTKPVPCRRPDGSRNEARSYRVATIGPHIPVNRLFLPSVLQSPVIKCGHCTFKYVYYGLVNLGIFKPS